MTDLNQTLSYLLKAYKHSKLDTEEVVAGIEKAFREAGYISPKQAEDIIGEDEDLNASVDRSKDSNPESDNQPDLYIIRRATRNLHRKEQRARLSTLTSGVDHE